MMLGRIEIAPDQERALEDIKSWTRQRFKLPSDSVVLAAEVACRRPGCPPLETAIAFWTGENQRHQFRLYKPAMEVSYDDIGWLFGSPASHEGWECC